MSEQEIRKKVDEDWKKKVQDEKQLTGEPAKTAGTGGKGRTSPVFMNFISNLAAQAMMHMGMMENPMTGQAEVNLDQAQYIIELFKAVEEKTRGNLSTEEETNLKNILTDLMAAFVKLTEAPPRKR